jgi:hypothetical protein
MTDNKCELINQSTLWKAIAVELFRGWEEWQLGFVPKTGCAPKMAPIGWPMGNSIPKPRPVITDEI